MYTEDEDYEFKIREINGSCVRELKNDATTRHAKRKRQLNFVEELQITGSSRNQRLAATCVIWKLARYDATQGRILSRRRCRCLKRRTKAYSGLAEGLL